MGEENWRLGHKVRTFGGVRQDCDPGALPPWMFRNLINVRFSGGGLGERGGQSRLNTDPMEGCVTGIIPGNEAPPDIVEVLLMVGTDPDPTLPTPGQKQSAYSIIDGFEYPIVNPFNPGASDHDSALGFILAFEESDGNLFLGRMGIGHCTAYPETPGSYTGLGCIDSNGGGSLTSSNAVAFGGAVRFHDVDYFAATRLFEVANGGDGTGDSMVCVATDPPLSIGGGIYSPIVRQVSGAGAHGYQIISLAYFFYRMWLVNYEEADQLVCPLEPSYLHVMDAEGAWRKVPMPAGCTINRRHVGNACVAEDGLLYFTGFGPGGGYLLLSYDGTDIVAVHTIAGTPPVYQPLAPYRGTLLYANNVGGTVKLGRYDGTTFDDDIFAFAGTDEVRQLVVSEGHLFALRGDTLERSDAPDSAWSTLATEADAFDLAAVISVSRTYL